jgi:hypothetical protein
LVEDEDEDASDQISSGRRQIDEAVQEVAERIAERDRTRSEIADTDLDALLESLAHNLDSQGAATAVSKPRSVFDDVDEH